MDQRIRSTKSSQFKAGEQNIYAYQTMHPWSTLRYAIRLVLGG